MRDRIGARTILQPVPARSAQVIEFTFGTPMCVQRLGTEAIDQALPIVLIGAQTHRRVNLLISGNLHAFIILFEPGGFSALFSMPAAAVTNMDIDARAALGLELTGIHQRLADVEAFEDRVEIADQFLGARLSGSAEVTVMMDAAQDLHRKNGCATVADLASAADLSVRQFERRFRLEIGMSPKLYARVVRFEAALRVKAAQPATPWTEVAHAMGYFDQMHMVHDFNRLSGESPSLICDQLDRFVRPDLRAGDRPALN
jgi:AraC-like DNA-binding protein